MSANPKKSTYPYALIRAFCDISLENNESLLFDDDVVLLPLHLIAEKWAKYYLPFFANDFLSQKEGESPEKVNIKFRLEMEAVISRLLPHQSAGERNPTKFVEIFTSKLSLTRTDRIIDTDLGRSTKKLLIKIQKIIINFIDRNGKGFFENFDENLGTSFHGSKDTLDIQYRHPQGNLEYGCVSIYEEVWNYILLYENSIREIVIQKWVEDMIRFDKNNYFDL